MQAYIDSNKIAGMVLAIVRRGRVGYLQTLGYADIERRTPIPVDGLFRIASMRKPIFAAATMKLVEDGKLRLDDPVAKYIPAFARMQVYASGPASNPTLEPLARPVTIQDLLTHTAGMWGGFAPIDETHSRGSHPVDSIFRQAGVLVPTQSLAEFVDTVTKLPLIYQPGQHWAYSLSIDVLNRVHEIVSGEPIDRYLRHAVLEPTGMPSTSFESTGRLLTALVSTPQDYLRFCQMLLNGGEIDGRRVLARTSVEAMLQNHLAPAVYPVQMPGFQHRGYGFGFGGAVLVDPPADQLPGTAGIYRWAGASGVFFWIDPHADLIAMLWTQTAKDYAAERDFQRLVYAAICADAHCTRDK
jgi:CubicO group peptidase (beta-lactamase class C family)